MKPKTLFFAVQIFLLFAGGRSFAQENKISLLVSKEKLSAANGAMVGTMFKVVNNSNQVFEGKLKLISNEVLGIVGKPVERIELQPKDSVFVSVNILVSQIAKARMEYGVSAILYDNGENQIARRDVQVSIERTKNMKLQVRNQQVLMEKRGGFFEIPVRLVNAGNTPQEVVLLTKLPHELHSGYLNKFEFFVGPFQDTLVVIQQKIDRRMFRYDAFNLTITGLYQYGEVFGRESVQVLALKTNRKYRSYEGYLPIRDNSLFLRGQTTNNQYAYYEARLQSEINISKNGVIDINAHATHRQEIGETYFRNTWIGYKNEYFGGRIGNLYKNYGIDFYGRGAEVFFFSKNKKNRFEVGAMEKTYRLFENNSFTEGRSFWAHYDFEAGKEGHGFSSSFVYDADSLQNYKNMLLAGYRNFLEKENIELGGGVSVGNTTTYRADSIRKYGLAAQLNLDAQFGEFSVLSNNFVSTSYFPGRKRGALNFSERVSYNPGGYSLFMYFNHFGYSPEYLVEEQGSENEFGLTRFSIGATKIWERFRVSLSPEYSSENREFSLYNQMGITSTNARLTSMRLGLGLAYTSKNYEHSLFFNAKIGKSHAEWDNEDEDEFQAQLYLNYHWGIFNLSARYQKGSFYLTQLIYNQEYKEEFERYYINPYLRFELFDENLMLNLGVSYSYDINSKETILYGGRANYQLPYGLEVFVGMDYYEYAFNDYSTRRIEFGLIKRFSTPTIGGTKHALSLFLYKDLNGDKAYSAGLDEIAIGQTLYINGKAFRSDFNGKINYKKLPDGIYRVSFNNKNKWYAEDFEIELKEDKNISIGLNKMTTVKGSVSYSSTILSYDIQKKLAGLNVVAIDNSGNTYSTQTNFDGTFILFLPQGKYTVSLITPGSMQYVEVAENGKTIETNAEKPVKIEFKIVIKEKRVEYKKFTSTQ